MHISLMLFIRSYTTPHGAITRPFEFIAREVAPKLK